MKKLLMFFLIVLISDSYLIHAQETEFKLDNSSGKVYKWAVDESSLSGAQFFTNINGVAVPEVLNNSQKLAIILPAARGAFSFWSSPTGLSFTEVTMGEQPDIIIEFASGGSSGESFGSAAAWPVVQLNTSGIGWADNSSIAGQNVNGYVVNYPYYAMAHEIGHGVVKLGHTSAADCIMNPKNDGTGTYVQMSTELADDILKRYFCKVIVHNQFGQINIDNFPSLNDNGSIYLPHNTTHNFRAVERIVLADYNKVFKTWSKDGINETSSYSSNITLPSQGSIKEVVTNISAEYNSEFEITKIFIDNSTNNAICNSETIDLLDDAPQTLTATKTINGVVYNCTGWKNADDVVVSSNYYYTFTPTVKASYKAMLSPKPAVKYFNYDGATGQNIHLTWSENSGDDSRISHYQIWRRVRHNNTTGNPQLIATLNRGTTEFTDYDYKYTSYYSDDLLWYDVRV